MAITVEQEPSTGVTVYNPIEYVLSSTNSSNDGFKYLAQLYINGTLRNTYAVPPEPAQTAALYPAPVRAPVPAAQPARLLQPCHQ